MVPASSCIASSSGGNRYPKSQPWHASVCARLHAWDSPAPPLCDLHRFEGRDLEIVVEWPPALLAPALFTATRRTDTHNRQQSDTSTFHPFFRICCVSRWL